MHLCVARDGGCRWLRRAGVRPGCWHWALDARHNRRGRPTGRRRARDRGWCGAHQDERDVFRSAPVKPSISGQPRVDMSHGEEHPTKRCTSQRGRCDHRPQIVVAMSGYAKPSLPERDHALLERPSCGTVAATFDPPFPASSARSLRSSCRGSLTCVHSKRVRPARADREPPYPPPR